MLAEQDGMKSEIAEPKKSYNECYMLNTKVLARNHCNRTNIYISMT